MKSLFEQMGGTYRMEGDYYLPNLEAPEAPPIGTWGQRQMRFLQEHRYPVYVGMLHAGSLDDHLSDVDTQAQEMLVTLIQQMATAEGITEELKANNQMEWVGRMNNIRSRAVEIVSKELIFI